MNALLAHLEVDVAPARIDAAAPLSVWAGEGENDRLVVSFTSIGDTEGLQPPEFIRSARGGLYGEGKNHTLFITDESRSWLNGDGVQEEITRLVGAQMAAVGAKHLTLIGLSMGAFMAIALAGPLKADVVVALSPQHSINPDIAPDETRWTAFSDQIDNWRWPSLAAAWATPAVKIVFNGNHPSERQHWAHFQADPKLHHFVFRGTAHNIPYALSKAVRLPDVFHYANTGDADGLSALLESHFNLVPQEQITKVKARFAAKRGQPQ